MGIHPLTGAKMAFYRARGRLRQRAGDRRERPELERFRAFYAGLEEKENVLFMFFTSDLLHWLSKAMEFVPPEVPAALIGADLGRDEIAWLGEHFPNRPFHHIGERVDDNTALDFVFCTAERHFGWLHIDCLVLNAKLFEEMTCIDDRTALKCIWSHPGLEGLRTLHSAFAFVNFQVLEEIRATGLEVWPVSSNYQGSSLGRTITHRKLYSRVPTRRQVELLARLLPLDESGLPRYPVGHYFHILALYQLLAQALGYRLHHARDLVRDGSTAAAQYSEEIIHVNGVATYKRYKSIEQSRGYKYYPLLLQADYTILEAMGAELPPRYSGMREELRGELERLGIPEEQAAANLSGFLMERGISEECCSRILGAGESHAKPQSRKEGAK